MYRLPGSRSRETVYCVLDRRYSCICVLEPLLLESAMTKHNEELASHAAELLDMIRNHQYGLRGFGDGSLSRGRNLTDKERCTIEQALRLATAVEQKPVAWWEYNEGLDAWFLAYSHNPKAKTRPLVFGDVAATTQPEQVAQDKEHAENYRLIRRGQHWSVVDGIGNTLRGEDLDAAVDAIRAARAARARGEGARHG